MYDKAKIRRDNLELDTVVFPKWILNAGIGHHLPQENLDLFFNDHYHMMAGMSEGETAIKLPDPLQDYMHADLKLTRRFTKQRVLELAFRSLFNSESALSSLQSSPSLAGILVKSRSMKLVLRYSF